MKIKVEKMQHAVGLPEYMSPGSAGMDLQAAEKIENINSGEHCLVPTGLKMSLPEGYEGQIRPRSGLALKYGITVLNSPGTIDSDFRGELKVILINLGQKPYTIEKGERIAQLVISPIVQAKLHQVESLAEETSRGEGGFGHSGK